MEDNLTIEYPELLKQELLFHYTKRETAMEHILATKTLRFSPFKYVNDPKESKERVLLYEWNENNEKDYSQKAKDIEKEWNNILLEMSRLICFSKNKRGVLNRFADYQGQETWYYQSGFFKPRMWAQYGDNHKGICLGINRDILADAVNNLKCNKFYRDEIRYTNEINNPQDHVQPDDLITDIQSYLINKHIKKYRDEIYFTKSLDWRDEEEYRMLVVDDNPNDTLVDITKALEAVILGVDFPEVYSQRVKSLVPPHVKVYKLSLENGHPGMDEI